MCARKTNSSGVELMRADPEDRERDITPDSMHLSVSEVPCMFGPRPPAAFHPRGLKTGNLQLRTFSPLKPCVVSLVYQRSKCLAGESER